MQRFYFHLSDGQTILDDDGVELADVAEVRDNALSAVSGLIGDLKSGSDFWAGEPWELWVTDQPDGLGKTFLTLSLSASLVSAPT
jgi:hypothetical protein